MCCIFAVVPFYMTLQRMKDAIILRLTTRLDIHIFYIPDRSASFHLFALFVSGSISASQTLDASRHDVLYAKVGPVLWAPPIFRSSARVPRML